MKHFIRSEIFIPDEIDTRNECFLKVTKNCLPRLSNVKTISSVTSGEYVGYREDFSLHLNRSPLESVDSLEVLMVRVEDLLPRT